MVVLGVVGIALGLPALTEACILYARRLHDKIHQFRYATELLKEDLQEHEIYTKQVAVSLVFVQDVSSSLSAELNEVIRQAISHLAMAFEISLDLFDRAVDKDGDVKRWWFIAYGKSALEKSLRDVNRRQDIFLRCLHYSVLLGGSMVGQHITDERLRESNALLRVQRLREAVSERLRGTPSGSQSLKLLLDEYDIPCGHRTRLHSYSTIRIVNLSGGEGAPSLIEYRRYDPSQNESLRRVRDIALVLHNTDATMGILQCRGFYPEPASFRCELVFPLPQGMGNPRTLRDLLSSPENAQGVRHSLTHRVLLAVRLSTAVLYVHGANLVHKNIRPENILLLEPVGDDPKLKFPHSLGTSFLMGFDFVRKEDEASSRTGDNDWEKNIYRHPARQGIHPEVDFNMLHDIYSLGVILLEIALWKPFVLLKEHTDGAKCTPNPRACKLTDITGTLKSPDDIRKIFVKKAEDFIPLALGEKFRDVVLMCLNCLDGGFGNTADLLDKDGVMVGLVFIQKVLTSLEEISI
jgi:hypothetical protein